MQEKVCSQCGEHELLNNLYGHWFCERCESKLGLHSDKTILKNATAHAASKDTTYEDEVVSRLEFIEKDFVKKKVKLMHILERLVELS